MLFRGELVTYDLDVVGPVSGAYWPDGDQWQGAFYPDDPEAAAAVPRGDCILDCGTAPVGVHVYDFRDTEAGREFLFAADRMPGQRNRLSREYDTVEEGEAAGWA